AAGDIARGEDAIDFLKTSLKARFTTMNRALAVAPQSPTVILVAGINGSGKTTSVAKIAKSLRDEGRSVLLAAADTFRAGAVAQLEIWAQRLGVDLIKGEQGADPAAVAFDATKAAIARRSDVLLIDTAGRLHTQRNLMDQLTKIRDVVTRQIPDAPHEVLLVLDATSGQTAIAQAEEFKKAIDVTGIFLAKLDGTAKGGIVIAIQDTLDIPVKLIGVGETPEDVEPFDPDAFIDAMFTS
ncbi:MAG: signal recognition particle-docking protein FtsY, partial [Planctomycetes bacterium]|nr:signal recognition particle-docking protein FtsY [Planctomycetota bacterium]